MLGRWKKFLGVFLAFAMVIAMMPGTALSVSAEEKTEISSVEIIELPKIGKDVAIADAKVEVGEVVGATAETKWEVWGTVEGEDEEGDSYSYEDWVEVTDDTFSATDVYRCFVVFTAQEGYCFSEQCVANGPEEWEPVTELSECDSFEIEIGEYTLTTVIDRVEVTACEVAEDCEVSASEIVCYSGEETVDDGVEIEEVWSDETSDQVTEFKNDKEYQLDIKLEAKSGYSFAKTVEVEIDDEQIANVTVRSCHISFSKSYSLLPVDQVDQFEMELPVVKAGDPVFSEDDEWDDYTVSLTWIDEEGNEVKDETFVAGKTYILQLEYTLKNDAVLAKDFTFLINDETYDEEIEISADRTWAQLEITYVVKGEITPEITITALPEFKEGAAIADANVEFEVTGVTEGSVKAETQWEVWGTVEVEDEEGNSYEDWVEVTDDTFSATDVYRCSVLITATGDYCFSEDYVVGYPEGMIGCSSPEKDEDGNYTIIEIDLGEYTKTTVIDKVEVTASEVKAGNTPSVSKVEYWSGDEQVAGAEIISSKWSEESKDESVNVFESGKNYQLDIDLKAKTGYSFAEYPEAYVNDKKAGGLFDRCHGNVFASFSTLPPVEHVEITEFPKIKKGEWVFDEVTIGCDCEKCEIEVYWSDEEGEDITDGTFEADKRYALQLAYSNYSGAALSEDFVFIIDEITYAPTDLDAENGQAWLEFIYVVKADTTVMKQVIPSVNITKLPEIAAGAVIKNANVTVIVPEDRATAVTKWQVWDTIEEDWSDVTEGSFSNTDIYRCFAVVTAKDGYCFSDYYSIYPEEVSEENIERKWDDDNNITSLEIPLGEYTLTTVIDKVKVTATEVKAGNTASVDEIVYLSGNVEVTEGVNLSVCEWSEVSSGDSIPVTKFEKERNYQLDIELEAKEGYSFAADIEVYINDEVEDVTSDPCCVDICKSYSLLSPVDHVELKVPDVKKGASIFEADKIVCDCENCEDCEIDVWWSVNTDEDEEYVENGTFEVEKTYKLQLSYYNKYPGVILSDDFVFIIDGKEYKATNFPSESQANLELFYAFGKENVNVTAASRALTDDEDNIAEVKIDAEGEISCTLQLPIGSEVTVSVTDENFINWLNKNGKIVTTETDYAFIVTGDVELTMSKKGTARTSALVQFVSEYDQVMKSEICTPQSTIELPAGPSKMGYTFTGWSLTEDEIHEKITAGETHITVKPEYVQDTSKTYKVTVSVNGEEDDNQTEEGILPGSTKTVNAPEMSGTKTFRYWREGETILGYGSSYSMQVSKDVVINAVYGDTIVEAKPVIAMTNVFKTDLNNKKKISFSVTRDVPKGYKVVGHGMLYNTSGMSPETPEDTFVIGADGVNKYEYGTTAPKGVFTLNVDVTDNPAQVVTARGYMIVKDAEGKMEICYSNWVRDSYN